MSQNGTPSDKGVTHEPPLPAPTLIEGDGTSPVILSIPHSGRDIPDWLASRAAGGRDALRALSDPYVDAIARPLIEEGYAAIVANAPRAAIDPNRRPDELDPMICDCTPPPPGSKAANGIGLIASRGRGRRPLWKERLGLEVVRSRLESAWQPYHDGLVRLMDETRERHGRAILLDLHSMPPPRRGLPRFVLGDRHGSSAAPELVERVRRAITGFSEECGLNHPYAGGAIAAMHGKPSEHSHVIQIEVDRAFYLDKLLREPGPGLLRAQRLLRDVVAAIEGTEEISLAAE